MLTYLRIQDFVIIESCELSYGDGFTVLTGETGAGKSIVVDALALLLGKTGSDKWIRNGCDTAVLEGVFEWTNPPEAMAEYISDGQCIIRRILTRGKTGRIQINGQTVPLKLVRDLAPQLAVIIGQHTAATFTDAMALALVDKQFSESEQAVLAAYQTAWQGYQAKRRDLAQYTQQIQQVQDQTEFLTFKRDDIAVHQFEPGEDERLTDIKKQLSRRDKQVHVYRAVSDQLGTLNQLIEDIQRTTRSEPDLAPVDQVCEQIVPLLDTALDHVLSTQRSMDALDGDIDAIEARLDCIFKLKTKYKAQSVDALLEQLATVNAQLALITGDDAGYKACQTECDALYATVMDLGQQIHAIRWSHARQLATRIEANVQDLDLVGARVDLVITEQPCGPLGISQCCIQASLNAGQPLQPIAAVASGGELSRLLLAMICANLNESDIPLTVVFDEIDAGIGGITGHGIGQKLAALAAHHQVLCVTHLAQVAQQANHHFYISKTNAQAVWQVASLSNADRKAELARMIGGKATLDELL